jgi:type II secretory pathway pseudopilin PulG
MSTRIINRLRVQRALDQNKQRGFSLWELAVVVGLVFLAILAGTVLIRSGETSQRETDRTNLLQAADFAITAYISENGRLPCPASDLSGVQDCSVSKGWLPVVTLGLDASSPARGVQQIRYMVYRNATDSADLAALSNTFMPLGWEKYTSPAAGDSLYGDITDAQGANPPADPLNAMDFCQALANAITAGSNTAYASVKLVSGGSYNVAYALAEPGIDKDSDGNLFDGDTNFDTSKLSFESPQRQADGDYDDRVYARTFLDVANHLTCPQGVRSLDALAQAVEVANEVADQKQDNADAAETATIVESVNVLLSATDLAGAAISMAGAVAAISAASAGLATNTALCAAIITAPVGCPLVAVYASALAVAIAAAVAAGVAIAANAVALALQIVVAVKTALVYQKATALLTTTSATDITSMIAQLLQQYTDAKTKAAADVLAAANNAALVSAAQTAYNNKVNDVYTVAHYYVGPDSNGNYPNDSNIATALQAYKDYYAAFTVSSDAAGTANSKRREADGFKDNVTKAKASWDAAKAISPSTPANIIAVTQQVADTAKTAETAAKAAAAADPGNSALQQAATDATLAAVNASLDASLAKSDPVNYVANKKKFYDDQNALWADKEAAAVAAEAVAAQKKTLENNALDAYNTSVTLAGAYSGYDQSYPNFLCYLNVNYDPDHPEYCYSPVRYQLWEARNAYFDWKGKEGQASQSQDQANSSLQAVTSAYSSYAGLLLEADAAPVRTNCLSFFSTTAPSYGSAAANCPAGLFRTPDAPGETGTGIVISSGAAQILYDADIKGTVK